MVKSFIILMFMVAGLFYIIGEYDLTSTFQNPKEYDEKHQYDKFYASDSIGRDLLDVRGENEENQLEAWNQSPFKDAFFTLFPNFNDMRYFIEAHLRGEFLTNYLLEEIDKIESDFFSGKTTTEEARRRFRLWQYK